MESNEKEYSLDTIRLNFLIIFSTMAFIHFAYIMILATAGQYMSTEQRPVFSWSDPPVAMPEGFINERVNMSDWEGFDKVGGVFGGSCWSETANLLTIAECGEFLKNKE